MFLDDKYGLYFARHVGKNTYYSLLHINNNNSKGSSISYVKNGFSNITPFSGTTAHFEKS